MTDNHEHSPHQMIELAIKGGADLEKLEKLLTLQERWEANEARKAYHEAMAKFKANPPKINKDQTVKYSNTKYTHASLGNVTEKISTELSKYGLSASWTTKQNGQIIVTCKITHIKGHGEETSLAAAADKSGSKNDIQAIGSTITYLERYTLLALTGLATYDQDDDGRASEYLDEAQVKTIKEAIAELGVTDKFLSYMGVFKVEDIIKDEFKKAMVAIETARNKKKAEKKEPVK